MSRTIDERVLQMEFDNARFQQGAQESIATLEKLNQSCQLSGATQGFSGLQQAIDNINSHFTVMGRVAERVMDTIVNKIESVVSSCTRVAKSLTFEQIGSGFEKYESITTSTQTIMGALSDDDKKIAAASGLSNMDYVTAQLKRMNQYTDETSYNLTDMTSNVGKFMSAGVDLQTSVSAMEGIANWAARSGSNVQQASHAMYNLSQAMGTGYVQLMDWKSIENASMATKEFKEQVIATAKEMGTLDKNSEVTSETFNSTLSDKWFTSDVLIKVLDDYNEFYNQLQAIQETEEGSGMTITDIIGEMQDNTELGAKWMKEYGIDLNSLSAQSFLAAQEYKSFSDVLSATKDAISTSWMNIFQDIFGDLEESKDLWSRVGNDFYNTFAQPIADLQGVFDNWKDMGGRNVLLEAFDNLRKAVDAIVKPIKQAFADIFGEFSSEEGASGAALKLLEFTQNLREFTKQMIISEEAGQGIRTVFREIFRVIDICLTGFKDLAKVGIDVVKFFADVIEGIFGFINGLETGEGYLDSFNKCGSDLSKIVEGIGDAFTHLIDRLKDIPILGKIVTWGQQIVGFIAGTLQSWINWLLDKFEALTGIKLEFKIPTAKQFVETLTKIGGAVKTVWDAFTQNFDASTPTKFLSSIWDGLVNVYTIVTGFLDQKYQEFMAKDGTLQQFFGWLGNAKDTSVEGLKKTGEGIKQFGENVKTFFTGINWKMLGEVGLVGGLALIVVKFKKQIDKLLGLGKDLKKTFMTTFTQPFESFSKAMNAAATDMKADAFVKVAEAIGILAISLTLIARLDADALARCTVAILALMYGISKVLDSKANKTLANSVKSLSGIMAALKSSITDALDALKGMLKSAAIAAIIVAVSAALVTLAIAVRMFANIDMAGLANMGIVAAGLMTFVAVIEGLSYFANAGGILSTVAVMLAVAPALIALSLAVKSFQNVEDIRNFQEAIGAFTAAIATLMGATAAINWLTQGKNSMAGLAGTILALSSAMILLGTFSQQSFSGLLYLAGAIGAMTVAVVALVGAAGLVKKFELSKSIGKIVGALKQLIGIVASLSAFNLSISALLVVISLFPDAIAKAATSIKANAKVIIEAVVEMLALGLAAIVAYKAKWAIGLVSLIVAVVEAVKDQSDQIIEPMMEIIGDILDAVVRFIEGAVEYVVPGIVNVINAIADAINNNKGPILNAISNLWDAAVGLVSEGISRFTGLDINFTTSLVDFAGKAGIIVAGISKISKALSGMTGTTGTAGKGNWMSNMMTSVTSTPANIVNNVKAIGTAFGGIKTVLSKFVSGVGTAGIKISDLGIALSSKTGILGGIGKVASAIGTGTMALADALPVIGTFVAVAGGAILIGKAFKDAQLNSIKQQYGISDAVQANIDSIDDMNESITETINTSEQELSTLRNKYDSLEDLAEQYDALSDAQKNSSEGESLKSQMASGLDITKTDLEEVIDKWGSASLAMQNYYSLQEAQQELAIVQEEAMNLEDELTSKYEERKKNVEDYNTAIGNQIEAQEKLNETVQKYGGDEQLAQHYSSDYKYWKDVYDAATESIKENEERLEESKKSVEKLETLKSEITNLQTGLAEAEVATTKEEMDAALDKINTAKDAIKIAQENLIQAGAGTAEELQEQVSNSLTSFETVFNGYKDGQFMESELTDSFNALKESIVAGGQTALDALREQIVDVESAGNTELGSKLREVLDQAESELESSDEVVNMGTESGAKVSKTFFENISEQIKNGEIDKDGFADALKQQMGAIDFAATFGEDSDISDTVISALFGKLQSGDASSLMDSINTEGITSVLSEAYSAAAENAEISETAAAGVPANAYAMMKPSIDSQALVAAVDIGNAETTALANAEPDASGVETKFCSVGKQMAQYTGDGITDNEDLITTPASTAGTNAGEAMTTNFETAAKTDTDSGTNFLKGFAQGLASFAGTIGSRCYALGQSFVAKFKSGLGEASPSKLTREAGKYFMEGFDIGVMGSTSESIRNVNSSAESLVAAFSDSMAYVNSAITDNLDMNPKITPVLDLSQVQNGSSMLASMLGGPGLAYRAAAASVGFTSPAQIQTDSINQTMSSAMSDLIASQQAEADPTYSFNIPLSINGRQIAKATRQYTKSELDALDTINNRKGGIR